MRRSHERLNKRESAKFESSPMRDKLLEIWDDRFDESYDADKDEEGAPKTHGVATVESEEEADDYKRWYESLEVMKASEVAEIYGFDVSELKEREDGYYELPVEDHFMKDRLPDGYGYKGGAARSLLERNLDINEESDPRDIDLIRLAAEEPEPGMDDELSMEYMPDDFEHGYGVENVSDIDTYMNSRDLTINELFATDKKVVATEDCIKDSVRRVLRVTDYEREKWGGTGPAMLAKIVRFYAESILDTGMAKFEDENRLSRAFIAPFYIALNLDKAMDKGPEYAKEYVLRMRDNDHLPHEVRDVEGAVDHLNELLQGDRFYFRNAPEEQFELEEELKEYENLPKHLGMGRGHDVP